MIKFSIFIFYIFVQNKSFLKFLPNFNLLRSLELRFIGPLFPRIYSHQWFYLFQVLVENLSKWHHFLKNTTQVEIITTIRVQNCTNIRAKYFFILYENCSTNGYCNFNLCVGLQRYIFLEADTYLGTSATIRYTIWYIITYKQWSP